ncbi:MFS transporter [Antrihabitans sp. YC2-6]|uniref:MFS transporter n=1 Tax=Antrihabitans sp. YC2-6 TaxID=2799498 RepID=UPI0018F71AAE|nr:MFS transporter [Antrihabitans sp. YC2-6]MBJ8348334.1 MFS transporter [Antrihabitans sp. YC2-6]
MTALLHSDTAHEGHLPGTADYRRVVAALFVAGIATFALLYSTQAILPMLSSQFAVSSTAATLTVSLTTLGLGVALLITGPASDCYGRTRLIHFSLAASALVGTACALAPNWSTLLLLRLLEGVVLAGLPAVATAYLREELDPSTHARAAGLYVGGTALGGMAGRLLTGWVAEVAGWRWALAATGILALACALAVRALLPPSRRFVSSGSGVRAVMGSPLRASADRVLVLLYVVGCCSSGALVAMFNALGFRLASAPFDLGLTAASLVFLVYPLGSLSSALFGRLADSIGRRAVLPLGCVLAIVGILVTVPATLPAVVIGLGLLTAGFFAVHGVASGWIPARAHAAGIPTGQAASLYLFMYYLGSSVFGSLAGNAWSGEGWPGVVTLTLALFVATGVCALVLRKLPIIYRQQ